MQNNVLISADFTPRDDILRLTDMPKESIVNALSALPSSLQESDVQDFCSLAQFYSGRTPGSFRQVIAVFLFQRWKRNRADSCDHPSFHENSVFIIRCIRTWSDAFSTTRTAPSRLKVLHKPSASQSTYPSSSTISSCLMNWAGTDLDSFWWTAAQPISTTLVTCRRHFISIATWSVALACFERNKISKSTNLFLQ